MMNLQKLAFATLLLASVSSGWAQESGQPVPGSPPNLSAPTLQGAPQAAPLLDPQGTIPGGSTPANDPINDFGSQSLSQPTLDRIDANDFSNDSRGNFSNRQNSSDRGATRDSFSASPTIMGDSLGGFLRGFQGTLTVQEGFLAPGTNLSGTPGTPGAVVGFNASGAPGPPTDLFTTGLGTDGSGDGFSDTFSILEPLPTSNAPGAPGPGFVFDSATASATYVGASGGTAPIDGVYTNGEDWFISYAYSQNLSGGPDVVAPAPGVAVRRIKIAENYSPDVRDRFYLNYSFFNDVQGGLGDVSRYIMGMERVLFEDLVSIELRLPVAGTFSSTQKLGTPERRGLEIGNAVAILKGVLLSDRSWLWTGGVGVTAPLASDTVLLSASNQTLLRVENETVHIQPFTGLLWHPTDRWSIQSLLQFDFAIGGDPVLANLGGGSLNKLGDFEDSTMATLDIAATRTLYEGCRHKRLQTVLANLELHYAASLEKSSFVTDGALQYGNLSDHSNILNLTTGAHFVFNNDLVLSPGISVPLRNGTDEQFDYEALVQLNYYH